jgi:hypothetical protein
MPRPRVIQGPVKAVHLRLPAALHAQLAASAAEDCRSVNSQIIWELSQRVKARKTGRRKAVANG